MLKILTVSAFRVFIAVCQKIKLAAVRIDDQTVDRDIAGNKGISPKFFYNSQYILGRVGVSIKPGFKIVLYQRYLLVGYAAVVHFLQDSCRAGLRNTAVIMATISISLISKI